MGPRSVRSSRTINHSIIIIHRVCMRSSVVPARGRSIGRPRVRDEGGTRGTRRLVFFSYRRLRRVPGVGVVRGGTGTGTGVVGVVRVTVRFGI